MAEDKPQSFDDILRDLKRKDPFTPFNIVMASGDKYLIEDPEMMVVSPVEVFYVIPKHGNLLRIRKSQIVALEELHNRPAA
jgi:hypothetical protein